MTTESDRQAASLWAANIAEHVLPIFEAAIPGDARPRLAIQAARDWAGGKLDMTEARQAAFAAHAAARQAQNFHFAQATAAARAAGHAAATAHVIGHAPHAANYALTAVFDPVLEQAWQVENLPVSLQTVLVPKPSLWTLARPSPVTVPAAFHTDRKSVV